MRGRVRQPRHERQELGEATWPAVGQDQRDALAAAGLLMHKMHPDPVDLGPEVPELVQPAFLRAPVEAVRPVPQQALQVTEVCSLLPRRPRRWPRPPRVADPRPQVGEDLLAHPDTELLCPQGSHPGSLASRRPYGIRGCQPARRAAAGAQPNTKFRPWRGYRPTHRLAADATDRPCSAPRYKAQSAARRRRGNTIRRISLADRYAAQTTFREGRTPNPRADRRIRRRLRRRPLMLVPSADRQLSGGGRR